MRLNYSRTGASGLIYDGHNLSDVFQIVDVSIPLLPTIEALTHNLAQRPGSYFTSRKIGTREIKVKLRLDAETRNPMGIFQAWREVSSIFNCDEPKRLYLNEDKFCNALLVGETQLEGEAYYGAVELSFLCFDPYFYGVEHALEISSGNVKDVNPLGNCDSFPTITATAKSTVCTVRNETTGEYVELRSMTSGTAFEIDMERQIATVGGAYKPVTLLSDFFSIKQGDSIRFLNMAGTLNWRDRWL